jgi:hypothetical protein
MRKHNQKENDRGFYLMVSIASAVLYLTGGMSALIVDPKLHGHVRFGARHYPAWAYWDLPIFGVLVLTTTYILLSQVNKKWRIFAAILPTWIFAIPTFWILRQELPHMGFLNSISLGSILTVITVWIHYHSFREAYLADPKVLTAAKLERVKQEFTFWRAVLLGALGGYLALLVSWWAGVRQMDSDITPDRGEQFLLNINGMVFVIVQSSWYICGVLREVANKTFESLRLLEKIPSE